MNGKGLGTGVLLAVSLAVSAAGQESWESRAYRQQRASTYRANFQGLVDQIPTLSPAEERWLKAEIDDDIARAGNKYTQRALTAMKSREYQIRVARPRLERILSILRLLTAAQAPPVRDEVVKWTELATLFMDAELWQAVQELASLKLVGKTINDVESLYFENHVLWAKEALEGFVLPTLRRLASKRAGGYARPNKGMKLTKLSAAWLPE